jgi:cytochrome c-type biogenesis protein
MENSVWQGTGNWFRKGAGVLIGLLGIYFIINPLAGAVNNILQ